jgi:hypothetical protein
VKPAPIPVWETVRFLDVALLISGRDRSQHILYVSPSRYRHKIRHPQNAARAAARFVVDSLAVPLRRKRITPRLSKAIDAIERAFTDGMYEQAIKLWHERRPKGYVYVVLRRVRFGELILPE